MLHEKVASNNITELQQAPLEEIELVDENGMTALALAAKLSNIQAIDILLAKNGNPYSAIPHASDPQVAQKLHAAIQPPPFYPPPIQHFYPYPPPMDMQVYYQEDQQQQQFGAQNGTLPPPDVARNIPCRFFPGCRYGSECIFMHPQPTMYLPPPQVPPFEAIPQAHAPFYQLPPQMVPPPFATPIPPTPIPTEQAQQNEEKIEDENQKPDLQQQPQQQQQQQQQQPPPPFMHPIIPQDPYMIPLARPPPMMMPNNNFRNNRNVSRGPTITKRGKDGQLPPCYFFPMGKCRNQDTCAFPHLLPDGTDVRDPALRGTAPINSHKRQSSRSNNFENKKFNTPAQANHQASFTGNKVPPSMPRAQAQAAASRTQSPAQRVPTQEDFPSLSSNVSSSSENGNYSINYSTPQTTPSSSLVLNNITNSVTKELPQQSFAAAASSTLAVAA